MEVIVRKSYRQVEPPNNLLLQPSSDIHQGRRLLWGITIDRGVDKKIHLLIDIPELRRRFPLTEISVILMNITANQEIGLSQTGTQTVILEPNTHYKLTVDREFSQTSIYSVDTLVCEFTPESVS